MERTSISPVGMGDSRRGDTALTLALRRRDDEYLYRQAHPEAAGIARPEYQSWTSAPGRPRGLPR